MGVNWQSLLVLYFYLRRADTPFLIRLIKRNAALENSGCGQNYKSQALLRLFDEKRCRVWRSGK